MHRDGPCGNKNMNLFKRADEPADDNGYVQRTREKIDQILLAMVGDGKGVDGDRNGRRVSEIQKPNNANLGHVSIRLDQFWSAYEEFQTPRILGRCLEVRPNLSSDQAEQINGNQGSNL
jgi:hypothetical protein